MKAIIVNKIHECKKRICYSLRAGAIYKEEKYTLAAK